MLRSYRLHQQIIDLANAARNDGVDEKEIMAIIIMTLYQIMSEEGHSHKQIEKIISSYLKDECFKENTP